MSRADGTGHVNEKGQPPTYAFDPELAAALALIPSLAIDDVAAARVEAQTFSARDGDTYGLDELEIAERLVPSLAGTPDVPLRIYTPVGYGSGLPCVLYIHGGGFIFAGLDLDHGLAATLARGSGAVVVAVDYRVAPEHPFPAALEDSYAALRWVSENASEVRIDRDRIAVAGSSAGGALAAAVALLTRDEDGPSLCFQLLNQPMLDDRLETPSMHEFVDTPVWNARNAALSWRYYLGDTPAELVSEYAAPARAANLAGLPPTYVATSEFDPLRDEGIFYALRLLEAGVSVELRNFAGAFHGSEQVETAEISQRQIGGMVHALRRGLRSSIDSAVPITSD